MTCNSQEITDKLQEIFLLCYKLNQFNIADIEFLYAGVSKKITLKLYENEKHKTHYLTAILKKEYIETIENVICNLKELAGRKIKKKKSTLLKKLQILLILSYQASDVNIDPYFYFYINKPMQFKIYDDDNLYPKHSEFIDLSDETKAIKKIDESIIYLMKLLEAQR